MQILKKYSPVIVLVILGLLVVWLVYQSMGFKMYYANPTTSQPRVEGEFNYELAGFAYAPITVKSGYFEHDAPVIAGLLPHSLMQINIRTMGATLPYQSNGIVHIEFDFAGHIPDDPHQFDMHIIRFDLANELVELPGTEQSLPYEPDYLYAIVFEEGSQNPTLKRFEKDHTFDDLHPNVTTAFQNLLAGE